MTVKRTVFLGAGGHAAVLNDAIATMTDVSVVGIVGPSAEQIAPQLSSLSLVGGDEAIGELRVRLGVSHFVVALGSTSDCRPRERLFDHAVRCGLLPLTVIHPTAIISPMATLAEGCQVLAGAIVNSGASIGANAIINTGAIVEHDCKVEDHCHLATGAKLAGAVRLGRGVHVGAGATVLQKRTVGDWAVVGAGAVVVSDVLAQETVVGVPARPLKRTVSRSGENV